MSFQTFVTERLTAITAMLNAISTNAKKIDDLPVQSNLDPSSKIHVSRSGNSESLTVQKIIDAINSNTYDQLLSIGEITLVDNIISIPADARAQINQINYNTVAITTIPIPYAATGLTRTDILVFNTSNLIVRVPGTETAGIAVRPNIPINTVLVTEINVTELAVSSPSAPEIGDALAKKLDKGTYTGNASDLEKLILKKHPHNLFKFVQKGFGNNDLENDELGDIFCGWSDDGTLRYPEAEWLGGPLNTSASFKPLLTLIIEQ